MASEANSVTLSTNFNVNPYYDDFDESKNFHRILFRPGLAVQARELTQMQAILQNQIDRFGEHIFKEGSTVRGLEMRYDQQYQYVKLRDNNSAGNGINAASFLNKTLRGTTSGVRALVINTNEGSEANTPNFLTLFVKYTGGNTSGTKAFANNEILTDVAGSGLTCNTITAAQGGATGYGAAVTYESGIVFAKDHFIRVPKQTVVLSKYSAFPTVRVGFDITETIVTELTDSTLLDPAQGSYNYAAPGAARLKLTADIKSIPTTTTVSNTFVELMRTKGGVVQSVSNRTQYAQIRDYMAQRTYDESGDYVVRGMGIRIQEHLSSANNGGFYTAAEGGDSNKLLASIEPGKAYAKGYDAEFLVSQRVEIDKATDYESIDSAVALTQYGNHVIVDNVTGFFDIDGQNRVSLRDTQANAVSTSNYSVTAFPGTHIGTARVKGFAYFSGTPGAENAQYKMYLSDIQMNSGYSFANVQFIGYNAGSGQSNGHADIILSNGYNANVKDPTFNRSIFRLPASSIKALRDDGGSVNNNFPFVKSYNISFDTSGQATINTTDSSETFDGSGALSSDAIRSDFHVVARETGNTSNLTGTIAVSSGNTVTGTATAFDTELNVGDVISDTPSGAYTVSKINSATSLELYGTGHTLTGAFHKRIMQGQVLDLAGLGAAGARGITISGTPSTTATLDINENLSSTLNAKVIAEHNKIDGQEASKAIIRDRLVQIRTDTASAGVTGPWPLGLSDGFRLVSVRKHTTDFSATSDGADVTIHFTLDKGATDNYYDHAKLVKKPSSGLTISSGDRLLVTFDHFTHSYNSGVNFFTVDSYPVDDANAGTDTTKIYTYEIPIHISKSNGGSFDLKNCVDFRPRIADTATSTSSIGSVDTNPATSTTFDTPSGGLRFPPPNQDFTTDLDYYLSRRDVISLSRGGNFVVTKGTASLKPDTPNVGEDLMPLASLVLAPYPSLPFEQGRRANRPDLTNVLKKAKNKRYTMKDIGQIAARIDRLEYQAALSLIEADTKNLTVLDENGLDRFKNGFFADNFTGHKIGNVHDLDYKISIDKKHGEMRPLFELENTELFYDASNSQNLVRTNVTTAGVSKDQKLVLTGVSGAFTVGETVTAGSTATIRRISGSGTILYVEDATGNFAASASITGGSSSASATISTVTATTPGRLLTLPYTHQVLADQPYATTTRNCAGTVWNFKGTLDLTPQSDYWYDTTQRPDCDINIDLNTDNWLYLANSWQTDWDAWETTWVGEPVFVSSTETPDGPTRRVNEFFEEGSGSGSGWERGTWDLEQTFITENVFVAPTIEVRSGVRDAVSIVTEKQSYGNFVRDVNINQFMRSRLIFGYANGMKPNSRLFAFFDQIDVNAYVTPLTQAEWASNLKDSSGAPVSPAGTVEDQLTSDSSGNAYFVFELPNNDNLKFRTGERRLKLTDNPTNAAGFGLSTTVAETSYFAEGLTLGQSELTVTTQRPVIGQVTVSETQGGTERTTNTTSETRIVGSDSFEWSWVDDPIAQSMLIGSKLVVPNIETNGLYMTKIDLFFATKDSNLPVTIELREVDKLTSYITGKVVPYSRVTLEPSQVHTSSDGSEATPCYFPSPVFLTEGSEYAVIIVPGAANPNYSVYTAVLGEEDLIAGSRVVAQPASGFMWTSANDRTWVPVENEDLKFTAYYAEFDKSGTSYAVVKNEPRDVMTITDQTGGLMKRAGEMIHGETLLTGTFANTVLFDANVASSNCFVQGMTSGATGTVTSFSGSAVSVRNVSTAAKFAGGEAVRFRLGANATHSPINGNSTGGITAATTPVGRFIYRDNVNYANTRIYVGNTAYINSGAACTNNRMFKSSMWIKGQANGYQAIISALENIPVDNLYLQTQMILPSNTNITAEMKMATSTSTRDSTYTAININRRNDLRANRFILSRSNESNTSSSSATMAALKSAEFKYTYDCRNIVGSPAIDLSRININTTRNLLSTNAEIGSSEDWVTSGGNSVSRYISRIINLADGQDSEDIRVYLTAYKPSGSDVHVYAKVLHAEDGDEMADAKWIPMARNTDEGFTAAAVYSSSENRTDFREFVFDMPSFNSTYGAGANTSNDSVVEYRNTSGARFVGFKRFAIKVVLTGSNSANPPRVRDLRAIALQR